MRLGKEDVINALNTSLKELQQGIDTHCCLVTSILLEKKVDERNLFPLLDLCSKRSREVRLEKAIKKAMDIIEESRKAFKSKRLEALREELASVLIDTD
jgi:hypothetical protein